MAVEPTERVDDVLKAGRKALKTGDRALAAERFGKAAELSPYDERVWLALLDVVTDADDRRVCLENVVRINPHNHKAARELQALNPLDLQAEAEALFARQEQRARARQRNWRSFRSGVGLGLLVGLVGALIGFVTSLFVYGFGLQSAALDALFAPLRALFAR